MANYKKVFLLLVILFITFNGFGQTNTVTAEHYWTDIKELSLYFENAEIDGGISLDPYNRTDIIYSNTPICLNLHISFSNWISNELKKADPNRVKALNIFIYDTTYFSKLREILVRFKNIEYIHIAHFGDKVIDKLPMEVFSNPNLKGLALNGDFSAIPEEIGNLRKLEYLQIGSDKLMSIPKQITKLSKLKSLYITGDLGFKKKIYLLFRYRVGKEGKPIYDFKINFSDANVSHIKRLPPNFNFKSIKYLMLKLEKPIKFNKVYLGKKYFKYLYVYPQGIFNIKDNIVSELVLLDKPCVYKDIIISKLIVDSIERLGKLYNCKIDQVYTDTYFSNDLINMKNGVLKTNSTSVNGALFGKFKTTTNQSDEYAIDMSKYPEIYYENYERKYQHYLPDYLVRVKFSKKSFIPKLYIDSYNARLDSTIKQCGKFTPIIEFAWFNKIDESRLTFMKNCEIQEFLIDLLDDNIEFSKFKSIENLTIKHISKDVDIDLLINELNKSKGIGSIQINDTLQLGLVNKIKDEIKIYVYPDFYLKNYEQLKDCKIYLYITWYSEENFFKSLPSFNPNLTPLIYR